MCQAENAGKRGKRYILREKFLVKCGKFRIALISGYTEFSKRILDAFIAENDLDAVVPVQPDGWAQPLCAFYKCAACLPPIEEMLRGDDWSLRNFLERINTRFVEFEQLRVLPNSDYLFLNINTPEDYLAAQNIYGS